MDKFFVLRTIFPYGGVLYLYRNRIKEFVTKQRILCLTLCILVSIGWYLIPNKIYDFLVLPDKNLLVFTLWLCYSIGTNSRILNNRVVRFLSSISLEMYLAQMFIFRLIEKTGLMKILGSSLASYVIIWLLEILGLIAFILIWKKCYKALTIWFNRLTKKET